MPLVPDITVTKPVRKVSQKAKKQSLNKKNKVTKNSENKSKGIKESLQKVPMSDKDTEIFILEVQSRPALWNYTLNYAKRKDIDRNKLWEEVIEAANLRGL